ncbi:hypothetical protein LCGC14_0163680 [marine sediment metagenome]|uniref:HNH nuclease domain-containing protein n=1 Tax=marine sediment metagenome TaxID=412755 RepID=A0A0F9UYC2_9ZZZZ
MEEQWRVIPSVPYYEISDHGRVRRLVPAIGTWVGRVKTPYVTANGYLKISLSVDKKRFQRFVHRLVAEAFIGPIPDLHHVHHLDHDKQNNRATNLECLSRRQNQQLTHTTPVKRSAMGGIPEMLVQAWARGWMLCDVAAQLEVDEAQLSRWLLREELPNGRQAEISQRLWSLVIG